METGRMLCSHKEMEFLSPIPLGAVIGPDSQVATWNSVQAPPWDLSQSLRMKATPPVAVAIAMQPRAPTAIRCPWGFLVLKALRPYGAETAVNPASNCSATSADSPAASNTRNHQ